MQKVLFIDRDGVIIREPEDFQIDAIEKLEFLPEVISCLGEIARKLNYTLVMVTNQDGLGTDSFPEHTFWPVQELIIRTLQGEGIVFDQICIDRSFPHENSPYRKPGTAMLHKYISGSYDLENSFVIGDRYTDVQLAWNLKARSILLKSPLHPYPSDRPKPDFIAENWKEIRQYLFKTDRKAKAQRSTSETRIQASLNLDGTGVYDIHTGLSFFDHMLSQWAVHGSVDLFIDAKGDLEVDEHHTIEDTAIVLGELFHNALGKKAGIKRYGFSLPMDEASATVLLDFGGRPYLVWDLDFRREKIGDVPTEMFHHFFKSFSDYARCNIHIAAKGTNEHHVIEGVFKAFARCIQQAKSIQNENSEIPSSKGSI